MLNQKKVSIIDKNFLINMMNESKESYVKENVEKNEIQKENDGLIIKLARTLPDIIKNPFLKPYYRGKQSIDNEEKIIYISKDLKKWSLDFLIYIVNKEKINFNLDYFKRNEDKKEILKFIKNKITFALYDKIYKKQVYSKKDLEVQQYYKKLEEKVTRKGDIYQLRYNNKKYILPKNEFEIPLFYHMNGIDSIPKSVLNDIKNKDIIDAGAYIGDSSLILNETKPSKIYAFEPIPDSFTLLKKTIKLNNLNNTIAINMGLGSKESKLKMSKNFKSNAFITKYGTQEIKITTIDNFCKKENIKPKLIKMDIEGFELEAIKGSEKIIKKLKPVLLICLYHTGKDFFEIPDLIKKMNPNYTLRFLNINYNNPIFEKILLAY